MIVVVMSNKMNVFEYYTSIKNDNVLVSYKGPVTDVLLAEISRDLRNLTTKDPKAGKKLFSVFIELAQNISYYSAEVNHLGEKSDKVGILLITQSDTEYFLTAGNLVDNKNVELLLEKCKVVNSLSHDDLRKYKREVREAPKGEGSRGAGIGIIQAALTSDNPLDVEAVRVNDNFSFFSLTVKIDR
jgi:hypothetical protein